MARTPSFSPPTSITLLALFITTTLAASNMTNQTMIDGPLFDKYQFLSPGIMMGFLVGIVLLLILYVGVAALSSLEITHAAFEKESGPSGSKKNQ